MLFKKSIKISFKNLIRNFIKLQNKNFTQKFKNEIPFKSFIFNIIEMNDLKFHSNYRKISFKKIFL